VAPPTGRVKGADVIVRTHSRNAPRPEKLEQTPGLIDAGCCPTHVRHDEAAILSGSETVGADTGGQVVQRGAVEHGRIIEGRWCPTTPLPNCAVYWMLFTPVTVSWPPIRNEELLPG